jgi:shikimate dehydrogenase
MTKDTAEQNAPQALTGKTAVYCILGNPVAHSMSPLMHNTAFKRLGLNAVYVPFQVENLANAVSGLSALGIKGASVTIPFKETIMQFIDEIDDTARKIGAVNTLLCHRTGIAGTNTDWVGAHRSLEPLLAIKGHTFVVIGAGGAARAVLFCIMSHGGSAIVVNRTENKGRALAAEFHAGFAPLVDIDRVDGDCLINTTPIGMHPKDTQMPVPKGVLARYRAVADVIYHPLKTMLVKEAEAAGCRVATGLDMFVYQGASQFEMWTGKQAPIEAMKTAVVDRLRNG